jgi:hypothetical protein
VTDFLTNLVRRGAGLPPRLSPQPATAPNFTSMFGEAQNLVEAPLDSVAESRIEQEAQSGAEEALPSMTSAPPSVKPTPTPSMQQSVMPAAPPPMSASAPSSPVRPELLPDQDSRSPGAAQSGKPSEPRLIPPMQQSVMPAAPPPMSASAPSSPVRPELLPDQDSRSPGAAQSGKPSEPRPVPRHTPKTPWPRRQASASAGKERAQHEGSSASPLSGHPLMPATVVEKSQETPYAVPKTPTLIESTAREQSAPTIRVSIGRVEVRAIMPSVESMPRTKSSPSAPRLTLEDYLKTVQ